MIHTRISSLGIEVKCSDADFRREAKRIDTEIVAAKILIQGLQGGRVFASGSDLGVVIG